MQTIDFAKLEIFPGARLLDLGCGYGRHSWQAYHYPGVRIVAADLNPLLANANRWMLSGMVSQGIHGGGTAHVLCADARKLPFADASFDLAVCSEVMEHVDDHRAAAAELFRVLAPGGRLGVSVPSALPERVCWRLWKGYPEMAEGHIRIYGRGELESLFTGAGFSLYAKARAHGLDTIYWWLRCMGERAPALGFAAKAYKRFLDGHVTRPSALTRALEEAARPLLAKSRVLYFKKK